MRKLCSVDNCNKIVHAWGWCSEHYHRWMRTGDPLPAAIEINTSGGKICNACGEEKIFDAFRKEVHGKYGRRAICKKCQSEIQNRRRMLNSDKIKERARELYRINLVEHPERFENKRAQRRALYASDPIKKLKVYAWQEKNKEQFELKRNIWRESHPEILKASAKKSRDKRMSSARGRLDKNISSAMLQSLKNNKERKAWKSSVNYTLEELIRHLENLFQPGMSWDNYKRGGWHIDHKIPIALFDYSFPSDAGFKMCWALDNLQPLWERDNLIKNDKVNIRGEIVSSREWRKRNAQRG